MCVCVSDLDLGASYPEKTLNPKHSQCEHTRNTGSLASPL